MTRALSSVRSMTPVNACSIVCLVEPSVCARRFTGEWYRKVYEGVYEGVYREYIGSVQGVYTGVYRECTGSV